MNTIALAERFIPTFVPEETKSLRIHFEFEDEHRKMTAEEFWVFCARNRKLRAELTKDGDVIIMPPTGFETSDKNLEILLQLGNWAKRDKSGRVTESNGGFILKNGAVYAPGAAWTSKAQLEKFSAGELKKFLPLCPDFVIELRSESDTLKDLQAKMAEYIENGARLGWLIDPKEKRVHVYRPTSEAEILDNPKSVSGEDVLVGFVLDLTEIW
ncbi:MAG TPA: Uma2 family endonuclease [Pyrinomonadaceae bacterium]|jgi:Uma2 family endonuclease